jgi:hypothetical protein
MTGLPILKWSLIGEDNAALGQSWSLIDTTQTPDTVANEFMSVDKPVTIVEYLSMEKREVNIYEKTYLYEQDYDPLFWSLVDTTPAPDSIFNEFMSAERPITPFYPASQIGNTGKDLYAGDMGYYIG